MTYQIEKNIQMPASVRAGRTYKYPFTQMEVGDSFFVPEKTAARFQSTASSASKRHSMKFRCRNVDGGVRCWRVE